MELECGQVEASSEKGLAFLRLPFTSNAPKLAHIIHYDLLRSASLHSRLHPRPPSCHDLFCALLLWTAEDDIFPPIFRIAVVVIHQPYNSPSRAASSRSWALMHAGARATQPCRRS